mgnify:CR=1 FL=1
MDDGKLNRICIINKDRGPLAISFNVTEKLVAGAEFKLYSSPNSKEFISWKMASKDGNRVIYPIRKSLEEINRCVLTWQVLLCSLDASVFEGRVIVKILQEGSPCKINIPAERSFVSYTKHTRPSSSNSIV